jgi:hypothetical protein
MVKNVKTIRLTNAEAIKLANERANKEGRSAANAAAQTIIESLKKHSDKRSGYQK